LGQRARSENYSIGKIAVEAYLQGWNATEAARLLALTSYAKEEYQLANDQTGALIVEYDEGVRTFTVQTLG
jgi:hypothetical protein